MERRSGWSEGWPLLAVLSGLCVGILALAWLTGPGGEAGVRLLIRSSARLSLSLFLLAFTARAARQLWPVRLTGWLLRNRRQLGVAFAVAHGLHLMAIATLARLDPGPFFAAEGRPTALIGGGVAYLLIVLMAATSSDRAQAVLGRRRWQRLHAVGVHYVWAIFTLANARRIPQGPEYAAIALVLVTAFGLRVAAALASRRVSAGAAG